MVPTAREPELPAWLSATHGDLEEWKKQLPALADGVILVLDDVLDPAIAAAARRVVELPDELFSTRYGLYPDDAATTRGVIVDEAAFTAASPERQMFQFQELEPDKIDELVLRKKYRSLVHLLALWSDRQLRDVLSTYTGSNLTEVRVELHRMRPGDFIAWHSDTGGRRRLALTYYIESEWVDGAGGELSVRHHDANNELVVPLSNRLVMFDVDGHYRHQVVPLGETHPGIAGSWRHSLSIWFLESDLTPKSA